MTRFDDFFEVRQRIDDIITQSIMPSANAASFISLNNALRESISSPILAETNIIRESLVNYNNAIRESMGNYFLNSENISESMQALFDSVKSNIELINENMSLYMWNYADMVSDLNRAGYSLSELVQQSCDEIDNKELIEDDFSSDDEILEVLQEQADNPKGFQERVANWSEAKKKKYYILVGIILFIWTNVFQPYFQDTIGKPVAAYAISKVKEFPKAAGKVIGELKKEFRAIITEDVPYYYKVTYTDEEGIVREGYVAKKNLKIIDEGVDYEMEEKIDSNKKTKKNEDFMIDPIDKSKE